MVGRHLAPALSALVCLSVTAFALTPRARHGERISYPSPSPALRSASRQRSVRRGAKARLARPGNAPILNRFALIGKEVLTKP